MNMLASIQQIFEPLLPGLLGIELSEVGPERVVASMQVRPELCTTGEVLHGGAIMAFADTLGAVATFANLPKGARTTTIESKTNFLGAAPAGTRVTGVVHAVSPRPHDDGVADAGQGREREAVRGGHADADGAARPGRRRELKPARRGCRFP